MTFDLCRKKIFIYTIVKMLGLNIKIWDLWHILQAFDPLPGRTMEDSVCQEKKVAFNQSYISSLEQDI